MIIPDYLIIDEIRRRKEKAWQPETMQLPLPSYDVPDDDFAVIVKAVFRFAVNGEHEQVTGLQKALVEEMTDFLEENAAKYEEVCEKRRLAGSIGGKQKAANAKQTVVNGSKCYDLLSKSKQNVADNDNDNDNEYEKKKKMCSNEHIKEIADAWNATFANTDVPKVTILKPGSKRAKMLQARLDEYGNLPDVCVGTGWKNDRKHYLTRPRCIGDPHGQAPLLWLCGALAGGDCQQKSDSVKYWQ